MFRFEEKAGEVVANLTKEEHAEYAEIEADVRAFWLKLRGKYGLGDGDHRVTKSGEVVKEGSK